jgi:serine phosphatase RsbU (regulator of sigma subunit)
VNVGWLVFLGLWSISLGELIGGAPHSLAWNLAVFFFAVALLITVKTYHRYRRELRFLREFHHLSQTMDELRPLSPENSLSPILEAIVKIVGCDRAVLLLKDESAQTLRAVCGFCLDEAIRARLVIPRRAGPSAAWRVMETGEPLIIAAPHGHPEINQDLLELLQSSVIGMAPIFCRNEALGLLMIDRHRSNQTLSDDDLLQLQVLADQVGVALRNQSMHREITEKAQVLETQNLRICRELQLAKLVQDGVLPRVAPQWEGMSVSAFMRAAHFIGGDFFSYLDGCCNTRKTCLQPICEPCEHFSRGILIGDVSGKGIPAALVMAVVHSLFREKVFYYSDPGKIMTEVNMSLKTYLGAESRFHSSAFLGFCLPRERTFVYANAGHDFPFFYRARTRELIPLESTGTLLGIFRESEYTVREVSYEPGDWFFFYTDGLIEYLEKKLGHEDGVVALEDLLRTLPCRDARTFLSQLEQRLSFTDEETTDDVTAIMMVVDS